MSERHALRATAAAALLAVVAGCSSPPSGQEPAGPGPAATSPGPAATVGGARLEAVLDSPVDIELSWQGGEPGTAGHVLEFATDAAGPYTALQYLPPGRTTYRHPDLIPETPFFYRLRTFRGPASRPVDVRLPEGKFSTADQESDHAWVPPRTVAGRNLSTRPVRSAKSAAAPTGLKATVKHANGILFTWTDNAADETGQLLEARTSTGREYEPVAVLDADINSYGLITLPGEKNASYRIRAFTHGGQSNMVRLRTGQDPEDRG